MADNKQFHRLPKAVVPENYAIRLHPDLVAFTFAGHEDITVVVKEAVKEVTLNSVDITIQSAKFISSNISLTGATSYNEKEETVTITFLEALPIGQGQLTIDFTGNLNDKMKGFYRSKYTHPNGETRYAAATQFEPTDARRAFPGWDEPAVKATFDITLVAPKDRVALSNMDVAEVKDHETDFTLKVVRYSRTPIMSTYLLAFIVGEYDFIEDRSSDGVLVRVYTPLEKTEQGKYALEVAVKTLPFYKEYFGIAYPLPKMDLITIADFAAGAMENWGLITYRETALLVDPENSSTQAKQWVALVVGHEIAHMWFGNLVTMEWWTHLWLNEGFASFVEYLCVDHCFPEYNIWNQFVTMDLNRALELDALKNSHPIEVPVGHPSEIDEIFDLISYSKGASVIRMLHNWIGDKDFKKGMNSYLNRFKYKNAATGDLWEALEEASGKPVGKVMHTWTAQMGFPVLKVLDKQEGSSRILEFTQTKFSADGELPPQGDSSPLWLVPVSISCASKPGESHTNVVIDKPTMTVKLDNIGPDEWIKINPGQYGVYRVQYSSDMLSRLLPGVQSKALPPRDRLGLSNDLFALCSAGVSPTVEYLRLVEAFTDEDEYTVWLEIAGSLQRLATLLTHTDFESSFEVFIRKLFHKIGAKLGWDAKEDEGLCLSVCLFVQSKNLISNRSFQLSSSCSCYISPWPKWPQRNSG
jgi:puromycin-sensitive aminopeptidase